jgi:transcriptional regulator with XRE-family HTH domain
VSLFLSVSMPKVKCDNCDELKLCVIANRKDEGTYRREGRLEPKNICLGCAEKLVDQMGDSKKTISRWENRSLIRAVDLLRKFAQN